MKIVIDIPDKWYRWAKFNNIENGSMVSKGILDAVGNGTPLPDDAEILTKEAYSDLCTRAADVPVTNVGKLDNDPIDIDKAVEHYEGTLETLKGIDLEVDG